MHKIFSAVKRLIGIPLLKKRAISLIMAVACLVGAALIPRIAYADETTGDYPPSVTDSQPDGEQTPPDGEQTPPDGEQAPPDGEQAPPDGEQAPPDGEQAPPDGEQTPPDGEQTPPDNGQVPTLYNPEDGAGVTGLYSENGVPCGYANGTDLAAPSGGFMGIMAAAASISPGYDLNGFVTGVVIRDAATGNPVTNGNYYYNSDYIFRISFSERTGPGGQFAYSAQGSLVYQLPSELHVTAAVTNGKINVLNGVGVAVQIGEYTITTGGLVAVKFYNKDNQGNDITQNFIDYYTNASFWLDISATFGAIPSDSRIVFGADATITVNNITNPPAALTIVKGVGAIDPKAETVNYTTTITAAGGPVNNIVLTDAMIISGNNVPSNTALNSVYGNTGDGSPLFSNVKYSVNSGSAVNAAFAWDGALNAWKIDLSGVGTLNAGDKILVTYTVNLSSVFDDFAARTNGANKWIQRLSYNQRLNNTVKANGSDVRNGGSVPEVTATASAGLTRSNFLTKTGSYRGAATPPEIQWTATAGDGYTRLNGLTITDTLQDGQMITGSIAVRVWGEPNSSGTFSSPYTLSPAEVSGCIGSINAAANGGFDFTVPTGGFTSGSPQISDVYRVEFVYSATRDGDFAPASGSSSYRNTINLIVNGTTYSTTATVSVSAPSSGPGTDNTPTGVTISKTSGWVYDGDGNPSAIKYTITMTVPAGNKGTGFIVLDDLKLINGSTELYVEHLPKNFQNYTITLDPPESNFNGSGSNINHYFYLEGIVDQESSGMRWSLAFGRNGGSIATTNTSNWPYDDEKTLTISYEVRLDTIIKASGSTAAYNGKTIGDVLSQKGWYITNIVSVNNRNNWNALPGLTRTTYDCFPIYKENSQPSGSTVFNYTVTLNNSGSSSGTAASNLKSPVFVPGQPAIFEDTFDPRLEYVPNSFYVEAITSPTGPIFVPFAKTSDNWDDYFYKVPQDLTVVNGNTIQVDFSTMNAANTNSGDRHPPFFGIHDSSGATEFDIDTYDPNWYTANVRIEVHYQLRLKAEFTGYAAPDADPADQVMAMTNTATVTVTGDKWNGGNGRWSASSTVSYTRPKAVTKDFTDPNNYNAALGAGGDAAGVNIVINPLGARLRDQSIDSPYFEAVDTMSQTLAFYLQSVTVEYMENTGGEWSGVWIPANIGEDINDPGNINTPADLWSVSFIPGTNQLKIVVKDETPVRIRYQAQVTAAPGAPEGAVLENRIEVWGEAVTASKTGFTVQETSAGGGGSRTGFRIYKQDEDTRAMLSGAGFELYMAVPDTGSEDYPNYYGPEADGPPGGLDVITVNGIDFYIVQDNTYNSGVYTYSPVNAVNPGAGIYSYDSPWITASHSAVYLIKETTAPAGYAIPAGGGYTFIALTNTAQAYWQSELGQDAAVKLAADTIVITNASIVAPVVIQGVKNVTVPEGFDGSATFGFQLTQVTDSSGAALYSGEDAVAPDPPPYVNVIVSPKTDGMGDVIIPVTYEQTGFQFPAITGLKLDMTYYFKVDEVDVPTGWTSRTAAQIVTVTVDGEGRVTTTYPAAAPDSVVFLNSYSSPAEPFANATIPVQKAVMVTSGDGNSYEHGKTFTFHIEEVEEDIVNGGFIRVDSSEYINDENDTITILDAGQGQFIIEDLPVPAGDEGEAVAGSYYFRIWEDQTNSHAPWIYDESYYIVRVDVTYDENLGGVAATAVLGRYSPDGSEIADDNSGGEGIDACVFTNSYHAVKPRLPETGGHGMWPYIASACMLMASSLLFYYSSRVWKKGETRA